ncbi:hypothetical protein PYW08_011512 [Mythimna loreyi]|uniref:Uncharacterized protein n=1 Tax=Mythimna loreyi TaxID=667449 RepID=A0ACC2QKR0_9NEOP|nr:hypothetical protein PYW08_011512 [Mythimna loreyi]
MNFFENITLRRNRSRRSESNHDESNNTTMNCTTNSMPEMSEDEENSQIKKLQDKIDELTSQLNSAHKEIEILSLENSSLKQSNEDLVKKNNLYKQIASSPVKHKSTTPKKTQSKLVKHTPNDVNIGNTAPSNQDGKTKTKDVTEISSHNNRITSNILKPSQKQSPIRHKICILSSENSSRICKLIDNTSLSTKYEICHYRKPNCNLELILDNIDGKVQNFTKSDFCIICIGEEDFKRTQNYIELVGVIRKKIVPLNHTNFIICLPTFKFMTNVNIMFNSRVETFNNLLYMDTQTSNYAYVLDSNLNLPYTFDTYNPYYGTLNQKGLQLIILDLIDLISYCTLANTNIISSEVDCSQGKIKDIADVNSHNNSQFFL